MRHLMTVTGGKNGTAGAGPMVNGTRVGIACLDGPPAWIGQRFDPSKFTSSTQFAPLPTGYWPSVASPPVFASMR